MSHRRFAVWLVLSCSAIVLVTPLSGSEGARPEPRLSKVSRSIVVTTAAELVAALAADPAHDAIFVQPGTYQLSSSIQVPDGTALIGGGEMLNGDGLPTGFVTETRTVLVATAGVAGNFVTLGDGASLQGLIVQDVVRPAATGGSVVAISSRKPNDSISAQVAECEIINPNSVAGPGLNGPVGRGLLVQTRNRPSAGGDPHEQSLVSVHLTHSIIRSPGGGDGIFAINFASGSHIELHLRRNVVGKLGANGGVSRPDSTVGATTLIQSTGNLYRVDILTPTAIGWQIQGGSDAPMLAPLIAEATLNNKLSMHSVDDRIEGFARAIVATAGMRMSAQAAVIAANEMQLILEGTRLSSTTSDFQLFGARNAAGVANDNELRVTMRNVIGSGSRANMYVDALSNLGTGNRLVIAGSLNAFRHTNEAIEPLPGEEFFTAGGRVPVAKVRQPAPGR